MPRIAWLIVLVLFVGLDFASTGCGGSASADKTKRGGGRRRTADELDNAPAVAAVPPPAVVPAPVPPPIPAQPTPPPPLPVTPTVNVSAPPPVVTPMAPVAGNPTTTSLPMPTPLPAVTSALPPISPDVVQRMRQRNAPPIETLDAQRRWALAMTNLQKIGRAVQRYYTERGDFHATTVDGLSWRVAILPFLGYSELYEQFDRKSPWDSPRNQELLACIPPEFQSPDRFDTKTNYVMVTPQIKAGVQDQVVLVEVADFLATPWTAPNDYKYDQAEPANTLCGLRNASVLLMLSDFQVRVCPKYSPPTLWRGLLEGSSSEAFVAVRKLPLPAADALPQADIMLASLTPMFGSAAVVPTEPSIPATSPGTVNLASLLPDSANKARDSRIPVPTASDQRRALAEIRELYRAEYEAAQRVEGRQAFLNKMITESSRLIDDNTSYYTILDVARRVAIQLGDLQKAFSITDTLDARFRVDGIEEKCDTLQQFITHTNPSIVSSAGKEAEKLMVAAYASENYTLALKALEIVQSAAKKVQAKGYHAELSNWKEEIEHTRKLLDDATAAVPKLQKEPNNPAANEALGKYLCFVKGRWDVGLPFLAKSDDVRFKIIASVDLESSKSAANAASLAEQWWTLADSLKHPLKRNAYVRGVYWGEQAVPTLNNTLQRVKFEAKLAAVKKDYARFLTAATVAVPTPPAGDN